MQKGLINSTALIQPKLREREEENVFFLCQTKAIKFKPEHVQTFSTYLRIIQVQDFSFGMARIVIQKENIYIFFNSSNKHIVCENTNVCFILKKI
jgi:hypothetical protein